MSTYTDTGPAPVSRERPAVPAYGPVDAVLGYVLFYVLVDRATPTVVSVVTDALPSVSASSVRLGLALVLWFILALTAFDQVRRQLVALGVLGREDDAVSRFWSRYEFPEPSALGNLALVLVGGVLAAWTFDAAIETAVALIPIVATLDLGALVLSDVLVMVVFFVAFSVATRSLDRLSIGWLRVVLAD